MNSPSLGKILALALLAAAAPGWHCAWAKTEAASLELPSSIPQGGLLLGRVPPGCRLTLHHAASPGTANDAVGTQVRVSADGRFVIGAGRDESGPLELSIGLPNHEMKLVSVEVTPRTWQLERIEGVPEATVNPPPEIAARIEREQAEVAQARLRDDAREDYTGPFQWPVTGRVSGVYGSQRIYNGTAKSPHSGLDVAVPKGTPVHAPAGGIITFAKPDLYLTGGTVLIDHGHGLSSNFLHLSKLDVRVGDRVETGQVIGLVGATGRATGPHMHWGMNWFTVRVDPQLLVDAARNPVGREAGAEPSR